MKDKLNGMNVSEMKIFFKEISEKFSAATIRYYWANGELIYVMKSGTDLKEYSEMIELILDDNGTFEHPTVVKVTNEEQTEYVSFTTGDDLEGLFDDQE